MNVIHSLIASLNAAQVAKTDQRSHRATIADSIRLTRMEFSVHAAFLLGAVAVRGN
jgi:hypothetical protein